MVNIKGLVEAGDVNTSIELFNGKDDFTLWQRKMTDVLILQGLYETILRLENKAVDIADEVWEEMDMRARSFIELHLADHVLVDVIGSGGRI